MDWKELGVVAKALEYATKAHEGQYRKGEGQVPYITHPVAVANILWKAGERSEVLLAAALLHDTVEDCGVTHAQLVEEFGLAIANVVAEVTDAPGLTGRARKEAQVAKVPTMSGHAKKLKIADKTANVIDITEHPPGWAPHSVRGYVLSAYRLVSEIGRDVNEALYNGFVQAAETLIEAVGDGS